MPYDGVDTASFLSMRELQTLSEKMDRARHQLFLIDACYGGLFGLTRGVQPIRRSYVDVLQQRRAREYITAGGKDQRVMDAGPGGHSVFAGHFLKAIREGVADDDQDGFVTFAELAEYLGSAAANDYQTPSHGVLPGHEGGGFVFTVGARAMGDLPTPEKRDPSVINKTPVPSGEPQEVIQVRAGSPVALATPEGTVSITFAELSETKYLTVLVSPRDGKARRAVAYAVGTNLLFTSNGRRYRLDVVDINWADQRATLTLQAE